MKCVLDFWKIEQALKEAAIEYLKNAIEAHGGSYSWVNEDGKCDDAAPVVAAFLDQGPTDMKIRSLNIDGCLIECMAEDNEWGGVTELALSDIVYSGQIQFIIEALPEPEPKN